MRWIENVYTPQQGNRNTSVVDIVTFLFHCVSPELVLLFAEQFYDRNQATWTDSKEQHMMEARSHLETLLAQYTKRLPRHEAAVYEELRDREQIAFRIGRDLASDKMEEMGEATFFLSCNTLGERTGLDSNQAGRILKSLTSLGITQVKEKGARWSPGKKSVATTYWWLYSVAPRKGDRQKPSP